MQVIHDYLSQVKVWPPTVFRNLALFPLIHPKPQDAGYLTLDEALAQKVARVTEVSAHGSVPELKFVNEGPLRTLLLDGEELIGAKQNRVLNLTILAPAHSTLLIPVSCVEAGRWSSRSTEFAAAERTHFAEGRRKKMMRVSESLARSGSRRSDQSEVWDDIAVKSARMQAASPTAAMAEIYDRHRVALEDYVNSFQPGDGQVGALFAIDGRVVGLDLFDAPSTLAKLLPKLVRSFALDAIDSEKVGPEAPAIDEAQGLVNLIASAAAESYPAVGLGQDVRLTAPLAAGGALVVENRLIHLGAFRVESHESRQAPTPSGMVRASARHRPR